MFRSQDKVNAFLTSPLEYNEHSEESIHLQQVRVREEIKRGDGRRGRLRLRKDVYKEYIHIF